MVDFPASELLVYWSGISHFLSGNMPCCLNMWCQRSPETYIRTTGPTGWRTCYIPWNEMNIPGGVETFMRKKTTHSKVKLGESKVVMVWNKYPNPEFLTAISHLKMDGKGRWIYAWDGLFSGGKLAVSFREGIFLCWNLGHFGRYLPRNLEDSEFSSSGCSISGMSRRGQTIKFLFQVLLGFHFAACQHHSSRVTCMELWHYDLTIITRAVLHPFGISFMNFDQVEPENRKIFPSKKERCFLSLELGNFQSFFLKLPHWLNFGSVEDGYTPVN